MPKPPRIPFFDDAFAIPFTILLVDFFFTIGGSQSFAMSIREKVIERNYRGAPEKPE